MNNVSLAVTFLISVWVLPSEPGKLAALTGVCGFSGILRAGAVK